MCKKILIVDDDSGFVCSLMNRFMMQDCTFSLAESLGRAKLMLENNKFDVVLASPRVPGGFSYSLMNQIKSRCPETRMVFMSSSDRDFEELNNLGETCIKKNDLSYHAEVFGG